jgi:hypothetical protein
LSGGELTLERGTPHLFLLLKQGERSLNALYLCLTLVELYALSVDELIEFFELFRSTIGLCVDLYIGLCVGLCERSA